MIKNEWMDKGILEVSCQAIQHLEDGETHESTQSLDIRVVEAPGNLQFHYIIMQIEIRLQARGHKWSKINCLVLRF